MKAIIAEFLSRSDLLIEDALKAVIVDFLLQLDLLKADAERKKERERENYR